jgi:hypothetical protein
MILVSCTMPEVSVETPVVDTKTPAPTKTLPEPAISTRTPEVEQVVTEGVDMSIQFQECFDLDSGVSGDVETCDFMVLEGEQTQTIAFYPNQGAGFAFGSVFRDEPSLEQCQEVSSMSGENVDISPLEYYVCYVTGEGHTGFLHFKEISAGGGINFDWRTFGASYPGTVVFPEPAVFAQGQEAVVNFEDCFDLETGVIEEDEACDFMPRQGEDSEAIEFIPFQNAVFALGNEFSEEPTLGRCMNVVSFSSGVQVISPIDLYVCYQTGEGRYGFLFFREIAPETGITIDWLTFDTQPKPVPPSSGISRLTFIEDVTVPDGTAFIAGASFTKTWRIRNSGETTWYPGFALRFDNGDQMGGAPEVHLTQEVPPNEIIDVSVDLIAPDGVGEYIGFWMLRDSEGRSFGSGENADNPFYVSIVVVEGATGGPTATPISSWSKVTEATLDVDQASYSGECPVRITFSGTIFSQGSGSYVYQLLAGTNTPGFEFFLPGSLTSLFMTGGTNRLDVSFSLDIEDSVDGWAYIYISQPNVFQSNTVNFSVDCD